MVIKELPLRGNLFRFDSVPITAETTALQPLTYLLGSRELATCRGFAAQAEIGGHSNIRPQIERMEKISTDQLIGQVGTLVLAKWLLGTCQGHAEYARGREIANRARTSGDGGSDIIGTNIDVKTSLCRYPGKSLWDYNLLVRPRERHKGQVYMLALAEAPLDVPSHEWQQVSVHLMGWISNEELPPPGADERFGDASVVPAYELHPLPPFRWAF